MNKQIITERLRGLRATLTALFGTGVVIPELTVKWKADMQGDRHTVTHIWWSAVT